MALNFSVVAPQPGNHSRKRDLESCLCHFSWPLSVGQLNTRSLFEKALYVGAFASTAVVHTIKLELLQRDSCLQLTRAVRSSIVG